MRTPLEWAYAEMDAIANQVRADLPDGTPDELVEAIAAEQVAGRIRAADDATRAAYRAAYVAMVLANDRAAMS